MFHSELTWLQISRNEPRLSGVQLFCVVGDRLGGRHWRLEVLGWNLGSTTHQLCDSGQAVSSPKLQLLIHKM